MGKIGCADKFIVVMFSGKADTDLTTLLNPFPVKLRMIIPEDRSPSLSVSAYNIMF